PLMVIQSSSPAMCNFAHSSGTASWHNLNDMDNFRKLFAAIDFSPASDEALRQAHERAISTGAKLAVCHIVPNELRSNLLFPHISRITAMEVPLEIKQVYKAASARVTEITGRAEGKFELIVDDGTPQALILN